MTTGFGARHHLPLPYAKDENALEPHAILLKVGEFSQRRAVQHTAWMACNLLCRLEGVVSALVVDCPREAILQPFVIPGGEVGAPFGSELVRGINRFRLIQAMKGSSGDFTLHVGPGHEPGLRAIGNGWIGGATTRPWFGNPASSLSFGPYVAACYGVAEIFRRSRLRSYAPLESAFYDCWDGTPLAEFKLVSAECAVSGEPVTLAGVGAVGCAWLHAIWATAGIRLKATIADPDPEGVEFKNLNRYCAFGADDVGTKKASRAAELLSREGLVLQPFDGPFEGLTTKEDVVVCAVDTNDGRGGVQSSYRPRMLMAATKDLRLEVLRCSAPGENACCRCYNPPDRRESDEAIRQRLQGLSEDALAKLVGEVGLGLAEAKDFVFRAKCGTASEKLLSEMRHVGAEGPRRFAIGFVSVMAGTLLAAETCKELLRNRGPLNDSQNRIAIQFVRPGLNFAASRVARDPNCPACIPSSPAVQIWIQRFRDYENIERDVA